MTDAPMVGLPLAGIRVLDLTHVWSGPSATRLLGALGADVIKVEAPHRPDFLRGSGAADVLSRYPDLDNGEDPWNRNAWFNTVNTDKRVVSVNLKDPEGLAVVYRLVQETHLVIANFRPGVLARIGLDYDELRRHRSDVILIEMTGYGSTGPMSGLQAYGAQFDAMSGTAWLTGDGEKPLLTGFALSDPVAGLAAASAAVTAVAHWRRTGEGASIEVIQRDAMIPLAGEQFVDASRGRLAACAVNGDVDASPHDIFRTLDEQWIAIAVHDDTGWHGLRAAVDDGTRGRLPHAWEQARHEPLAVNRVVAAWVCVQTDADELASRLQTHGVSAAPVRSIGDVYEDVDFRGVGFLRPLTHPRTGTHLYPGPPLTLDGHRIAPRSPAPLCDEHTDSVLATFGGLSCRALADLRRRGVIGFEATAQPTSRNSPDHDADTHRPAMLAQPVPIPTQENRHD